MPNEDKPAIADTPDTSELDALAVETGVVDGTPTPEAAAPEVPVEDKPAPEEKPEGKPEEKAKTALEVVREVMAESREKAEKAEKAAAEPRPEAAGEKDTAVAEDPKKDLLTKTEWAALSDKAKARIGWLGNEVKAERKLRAELEPRAQMFDEMAGFVTATGMSQEQFVEGLNIMGWLVTDPVKAYEALKPIYENLQAHMGERLPADLQEQVDDGRIAPELAQELAFNRSQRTLLETKNTQRTQYQAELDSQHAERLRLEKNEAETRQTIAEWQARQLASDPDFKLKAQYISDRAYVMVNQEGPKTPKEILDLLDRAKGEVDKRVGGQQKRRGLNPVTVAGAGGNISREPTTPLEAARIALAAMRN